MIENDESDQAKPFTPPSPVESPSSGMFVPPPVSSHEGPAKKTVGGFLSNVASSAGNMVADIGSAVSHPVDTLRAIGSIPVGLAEKAGIPVGTLGPGEHDAAKTLDSMLDHFKERYGSLDKAKEALYSDPVGVMADVSTAAGGFGALAKGAKLVSEVSGAAKAASIAGDAAKVAGTVATATDPIAIATKPVSVAAKAASIPEKLYQSALKPGVKVGDKAAVDKVIQTGLQNNIPVSPSGVERLHGLVEELGQKIQSRIDSGAGAGVTVDPNKVAKRIDDIKPSFQSQVNPSSDLNSLESSKQEFLNSQGQRPGVAAVPPSPTGLLDASGRPVMSPGSPAIPPSAAVDMPANVAQSIKQGTYRQLKKSYGQLSSAQSEAQKALARGIKEELAAQIPEIADLNAKDSRLISLQNALENRVRVAANHNIMGIGTPILAGTVGASTHSGKLALVAGVVKSLIDDPAIKSKIAIAINGARSSNPKKWGFPKMATAMSRVSDYVGSLDAIPSTASDQQPQNEQLAEAVQPERQE